MSEDKLTWDCFYELHRADALAATVARSLGVAIEALSPVHLITNETDLIVSVRANTQLTD